MAWASGVARRNRAAVARGQHGLHERDRAVLDAQLVRALPLFATRGGRAERGRRVASVERSALEGWLQSSAGHDWLEQRRVLWEGQE